MSSSVIEVAVDPTRVHPTRPHIHIAEMPSLVLRCSRGRRSGFVPRATHSRPGLPVSGKSTECTAWSTWRSTGTG